MAAHRYWRLLMHSKNGPADGWVGMGELKGYVSGTADDQLLASLGVTATASNSYPSTNPSFLIDGTDNNTWASNAFVDGLWVAFDLGVGVTKDIHLITFTAGPGIPTGDNPKACDWQWSDDNATWTTAFSFVAPQFASGTDFYTAPAGIATDNTRLSRTTALAAVGVPGLANRLSAAFVTTAITFFTPSMPVTEAKAMVAAAPTPPVMLTKAHIMVAIKIGAETKRLRAWTFTMDGHDFYVLHLGQDSTLVFDQSTQQWCQWVSQDFTTWRIGMGLNWDNEIVGGDILEGTIWNIDASIGLDEDVYPIVSYITGFVGWRGRDPLPCYGVTLVGAVGNPASDDAFIQLRISDDFGKTFYNMGAINTPILGKYDYDLSWYSLGQIAAPGRIFQIIDSGAMERIDSLELLQSPQEMAGAQGASS